MRKKPLLMLIGIVLIVACMFSSIAYFTSKASVSDVHTVGSVKIKITEDGWNPEANHKVDAKASYEKDPKVMNIGKNDAYVRLHVTFSDVSALVSHGPEGYKPRYMLDINNEFWDLTNESDVVNDTVTYTYTYKTVLEANADRNNETESLFSKVEFPEFVDQELIAALGESFEITLNADAIQADGFDNYTEAFNAFDNE